MTQFWVFNLWNTCSAWHGTGKKTWYIRVAFRARELRCKKNHFHLVGHFHVYLYKLLSTEIITYCSFHQIDTGIKEKKNHKLKQSAMIIIIIDLNGKKCGWQPLRADISLTTNNLYLLRDVATATNDAAFANSEPVNWSTDARSRVVLRDNYHND